ncbi:PQQ-dependent catabolism-associated CXXCW motif protein [Ruegeria sp. HKCCD6228]|uniref:PQQ-dependent catabolism-associated CXXCW motif protein n=1 Tax=Ruegeria atlantica TaxID=81569 RepID=A0ABX1WAA8_9RHOB|nr:MULTISPECIES: PQQ-dependent catabolism-associated CXXCW motif protein [Ruegeria]NOD30220.1 PQQ-dependent catabolism-associated CXXCW motif protein [Ruegeria atlantica]NOD97880.1 PQQ-dependent catabolism-associated CXXCW motif protein [Ruegeria sp. HKCCD6228]
MMRASVAITLISTAAIAQTVPEPGDYRMDHYRAPVPDQITGGTVIGPEEAHGLWQEQSVAFIDVLPQPPKPANLPEGTIWRDKPRDSIPGSLWLPNVGYGAIADVTADYFRTGLEASTNGDINHGLVFFCLEDCWMSWNAARRAIEWGYTKVYWFPEGTDGWALWGYPLERVEPAPGQPVAGGG